MVHYVYEPYGAVTRSLADWTTTATWAQSKGNSISFCGAYYDIETGLYHVRNRMYHAQLGRWLQRDPKGYVDGLSLYEYCKSGPIDATDPMGEGLGEELWHAWQHVKEAAGSAGWYCIPRPASPSWSTTKQER